MIQGAGDHQWLDADAMEQQIDSMVESAVSLRAIEYPLWCLVLFFVSFLCCLLCPQNSATFLGPFTQPRGVSYIFLHTDERSCVPGASSYRCRYRGPPACPTACLPLRWAGLPSCLNGGLSSVYAPRLRLCRTSSLDEETKMKRHVCAVLYCAVLWHQHLPGRF